MNLPVKYGATTELGRGWRAYVIVQGDKLIFGKPVKRQATAIKQAENAAKEFPGAIVEAD